MLLNNAGTRPSNGENDVTAGDRSYFGGADDATAFSTVVREITKRSAICFFGTPSAASLRINAHSSKVITLQSSSIHFSTVATDQFSSVVDTGSPLASGEAERDHGTCSSKPLDLCGVGCRVP